MKIPIVAEVINAPLDYVSEFYYASELSVSVTTRMLEDQCAKMHIAHVCEPTFEDTAEYIDWLMASGMQLIGALDKDFTQHRDWWKNEPDLLAVKERIKKVLMHEWLLIQAYTND